MYARSSQKQIEGKKKEKEEKEKYKYHCIDIFNRLFS